MIQKEQISGRPTKKQVEVSWVAVHEVISWNDEECLKMSIKGVEQNRMSSEMCLLVIIPSCTDRTKAGRI